MLFSDVPFRDFYIPITVVRELLLAVPKAGVAALGGGAVVGDVLRHVVSALGGVVEDSSCSL